VGVEPESGERRPRSRSKWAQERTPNPLAQRFARSSRMLYTRFADPASALSGYSCR
jgi:hypothetical protein